MTWDDDKDGLSAPSSGRRFDRADGGKKDQLKKKIKEKIGMEKQQDMQKAELVSQVNLQSLKSQLSGKQDEEKKRREEDAEATEEKSSAPKTKTLKEKEEALVQEADDTIDPDILIQQEEDKKEVSGEETSSQAG